MQPGIWPASGQTFAWSGSGRVRRPAPAAYPRVDSLTPTEARIADLVSQGLSNPNIAEQLFLSRRTVQTHVSHLLMKLELRSRVDIATESARRETRAA